MAKGGYRGGMPMGGRNQMQMMKQAQKMQQDFLRMQKELEEKEFTAKSGGGMVSATVNGNREPYVAATANSSLSPSTPRQSIRMMSKCCRI